MDSRFIILKKFLSRLNFNSPNVSGTLFYGEGNGCLNIYMDTNYFPVGKDEKYYQVDLTIRQKCEKEGMNPVFKFVVVYSALVSLNEDLEKDEISRIMKVDVPQLLYDNARKIVANITAESGFPIVVMRDHAFSLPENKEDDEDVDFDTLDCNRLAEECMQREGYKYYYRFIAPIEYAHPEYEGFGDDFWTLFFQLLIGDFASTCVIDHSQDSFPALIFSLENYDCENVMNLSVDEVKSLAIRLMGRRENLISCIDVFAQENVDDDFFETLSLDGLISRSDFFELYGCTEDAEEDDCDDEDSDFEDNIFKFLHTNTDDAEDEGEGDDDVEEDVSCREVLDSMYSKILDCDMMTILYRM
ncbi:MAG: protein-export chaperone SecB [Bacteroidales bacterium]|nr:protein-export chaperone SecB [Bacteroidales bacterium]